MNNFYGREQWKLTMDPVMTGMYAKNNRIRLSGGMIAGWVLSLAGILSAFLGAFGLLNIWALRDIIAAFPQDPFNLLLKKNAVFWVAALAASELPVKLCLWAMLAAGVVLLALGIFLIRRSLSKGESEVFPVSGDSQS